ncbi:MAG: ring-cleaving dioxygenase [Planctomycetes bacterium]|nr:ring-cleaving dioxygenase [Planctomycetota bacterium]
MSKPISGSQRISGLHHVTAITSDAQKNIDFYCGVLGLRLVKRTVNFDDPGSYHLYYGDELGRPGTILTFFAWPGARRGRIAAPQVTSTAFAIPTGSVDFWKKRLEANGVAFEVAPARFGDQVLTFTDFDGMQIELIATDDARAPWASGPVAAEHAIRGFHSVSLSERDQQATAAVLTKTMGFSAAGNDGNRHRFIAADKSGGVVDLITVSGGMDGTMGAGAVHHVAFRTPDDASEAKWRRQLTEEGFHVSPVMDRNYFHSIYFREPGGVLFEIATDTPGFSVDEPAASLGMELKLPSQFESARARIESHLPKIRVPQGAKS